ncbi:MAG: hypothetical protein IPL28_13365 [Chloroflexi bacterium]|nr:hypothetical protein [Chloroflexota bacterium]
MGVKFRWILLLLWVCFFRKGLGAGDTGLGLEEWNEVFCLLPSFIDGLFTAETLPV